MVMFLRCAMVMALAVATGMPVLSDDWWNPAWKYRLPVRANFGMVEVANPLIVARVSRGLLKQLGSEVDTNSFRLIDMQGAEVPCVVRMDAGGDFFVVWRVPGKTEILDVKKYSVYVDVKENGLKEGKAYELLGDVPQVVPGMNLVSNGEFAVVEENGFPKDWSNTKGYGVREAWTEDQRKVMQTIEVDGKSCLRLTGDCHLLHAIGGLLEGRQYKLSLLGKLDPGASVSATVWFRKANLDWFRNGIGNYKTQLSLAKAGNWAPAEMATFVYADKDGNLHYNNKYLLPGTETAYLEVVVKAQEGLACLTDIRFELVGESSEMKVVVGALETRR